LRFFFWIKTNKKELRHWNRHKYDEYRDNCDLNKNKSKGWRFMLQAEKS
jgi:hypothetical protein